MHDVLRQRLMRSIEALPDEQVYQALDYVEFLASKYARDRLRAPSSFQRFGELLEDKMRGQNVAITAIRGTMGVVGTADRFVSGLTEAGRTIMREVGGAAGGGQVPAPRPQEPQPPRRGDAPPPDDEAGR